MTDFTAQDLHEMRRFMTASTPYQEDRPRLVETVQDLPADRVYQVTEHLYRHLQRADTDDFVAGLGRRVDAVMAVQAIDGLYEAFRNDDRHSVIRHSRQLHEKLEYCSPDQIAAILGRVSFRGQELDVSGLVTMLGDALATLDGRPRHNLSESVTPTEDRFGDLVRDLAALIGDWSDDDPLMELRETPKPSVEYADRLRSLLEDKYGIRVDVNRG